MSVAAVFRVSGGGNSRGSEHNRSVGAVIVDMAASDKGDLVGGRKKRAKGIDVIGGRAIESVERRHEYNLESYETFLRRIALQPWGSKVELHCADGIEFLRGSQRQFDYVVLMDVFEHFTQENGFRLAEGCHGVLVPGGKLIVRTPNMASVLGTYSRYIDLTHRAAYTEFSLGHLLKVAGFAEVEFARVWRLGFRRRLKGRLMQWLHRVLYKMEERTVPRCFEKNLLAVATKGWSDG